MRLIFTCLLLLGTNTMAYANTNGTLTAMTGKEIPFHTLHGKWVMINYWASWCQPCLDEINELNAFYREHHDNVTLFAVNFDGVTLQQQQKLIQKYHITYPSLSADPAQQLQLGDLAGVPATFVFNPQGRWVTTLYGSQTLASLTKIIEEND